MFSSLKKLFGAPQPEKPSVSLHPGQLFQWRSGVRLQATEDANLMFPGGLVRDDEQIGSIIDADDDAEMGFQKQSDDTNVIHLKLRAGQAATLHRSSDVILLARDERARMFYVLSGK